MKLSPEKIKEITENIGMGSSCYIHRSTGEMLVLIHENYDELVGMVGEDCVDKSVYDRLERNAADYFKVEKMESYESFKVMERFIEETDLPRSLKGRLLLALDKRKPFRQFKYLIDGSDYREAWFAYRDKKMEEHVERQVSFL